MEFNYFAEKCDGLFKKIKSESPYLTIITGDFNAHLNEWFQGDKNYIYVITIQDIFNKHGISQLVNQQTFITNIARTCLDIIGTDQPN